MDRLHQRERQRYGDRILPGGDMHQNHLAFIAWAERYDTASSDMRSLATHEAWMKNLRCPVIRLDSKQSTEVLVSNFLSFARPE